MLYLNILNQVSLEIWDTGSMIYALNKPLNNEIGYTWRASCLCFYFMLALLWAWWLGLKLALGNIVELQRSFQPSPDFSFFFFGCTVRHADLGSPHWPGMEPVHPAMEVRSLNDWTAKEVPILPFFLKKLLRWLVGLGGSSLIPSSESSSSTFHVIVSSFEDACLSQ